MNRRQVWMECIIRITMYALWIALALYVFTLQWQVIDYDES